MKFASGFIIGLICSALVTVVGIFITRYVIIQQRTVDTSITITDTSINDTSYMWLDTTHGEYQVNGNDTNAIYTYHTNGMSALIRIYHMPRGSRTPTRVIYQDSRGIPRAVRTLSGAKWVCLDRTYMDRLIQHSGRSYENETYYQAVFHIGYDQFRIATNPIACENQSY